MPVKKSFPLISVLFRWTAVLNVSPDFFLYNVISSCRRCLVFFLLSWPWYFVYFVYFLYFGLLFIRLARTPEFTIFRLLDKSMTNVFLFLSNFEWTQASVPLISDFRVSLDSNTYLCSSETQWTRTSAWEQASGCMQKTLHAYEQLSCASRLQKIACAA